LSITPTELAWIAGLVEGEGCIRYAKTSPELTVGMTDRDVITRLAAFWGISPRIAQQQRQPHWKVQYVARMNSNAAIGWMMTLYAWLGERRRAKIREVIAQWRARGPRNVFRMQCPQGHPYTGNNVVKPHADRVRDRQCRICRRASGRRYWAKKRADVRQQPLAELRNAR
jgi:hypothetical protein